MKDLAYRAVPVVSSLPAPSSALAGVIARLASDNKPYWCDGLTWSDLTAGGDDARLTVVRLGADVSNSTTTLANVTGLGIALAVVLAGCSSPRDPFLNQQERPTELCLNDGSFPRQLANTDDAFQQQYPMRYVVKKGDTLWAIAESQYGKGKGVKHTVIFEANRPMLSHPDKIYPGQVLRIPELES